MTNLIDLPEDILTIIFTFLPAKEFLALAQTNKDLYQYRQDPTYWRTSASTTFRLPISPLLKADGARWYWLYKRLKLQTRLYTWGQGVRGNLGPGVPLSVGPRRMIRGRPIGVRPPSAATFQRTTSSWPTQTSVPDEVKVIADLQCGGWSTSILSSEGKLYVVGIIDSMDGIQVGAATDHFTRLRYLTQSTSAIHQFSSGRRHILAITDDGEILSWDRINANGLKVFSRNGGEFGGRAVRVVAGWAESSAYVPETGIVYWRPIQNNQPDPMLDGLVVKEKVIPGTARSESNGLAVVVVCHVILEGFALWLTSDSKVYACDLHTDNADQLEPTHAPFEVPGYTTEGVYEDVQGQYNKFAVFSSNGEVFAGDVDYLKRCAAAHRNESSDLNHLISSRPADIPALQHQEVIQLAFGDHHYHALHANGTITAYGTDSQECGTLGLGGTQTGGRFRGLLRTNNRMNLQPDAKLIRQAEEKGRQVWFDPEKRDWLSFLEETHNVKNENDTAWQSQETIFHFSEWVEQEGRHWNDGPTIKTQQPSDIQNLSINPSHERQQPHEDFHLDPYFAIGIAAAGWHSGALILFDQDRAEEVRLKWITTVPNSADDNNDDEHKPPGIMPGHFESGPTEPEHVYTWKLEGFPKVRLPNGTVVPGVGEERRWRS